jgi:hypothetical protein
MLDNSENGATKENGLEKGEEGSEKENQDLNGLEKEKIDDEYLFKMYRYISYAFYIV